MRRLFAVLSILTTLAIAFAPAIADARAGGGSSMGSRGGRSYMAPPSTGTAPSAAPLERSMTAPSNPGTTAPAYGNPGYAPAFGGRSSFTSGLIGGFVGAGLAGMLFGHGFGGGGGFFWFLVQIALVVLVGRWLFRRFSGPQPFLAGMGSLPRMLNQGAMNAGPQRPGMPGNGQPSLALSPTDFQTFDRALQDIQAAWTQHDLAGLRTMTTPEMLSYFAEQLAGQESRGVRNSVTDVRLLKGDLSEAWQETGRDYATVAMRFSMIDVTRDRSGAVVDGSPSEHVTATEFWTFLRAPGGRWLLSAIQQAR